MRWGTGSTNSNSHQAEKPALTIEVNVPLLYNDGMDNSFLKLVLSLQSSPGVYALLLGSGVSRAAGIPTGWEIVKDLIRRLATASGEEMLPDAETWYKAKFVQEPSYADLLERICPTSAERSSLLASYFEPTAEEREQGIKVPTAAHKSIAALVKDGFIKVILTTNFDRLLEIALEEEGLTPDVISSDDMLSGSIPYVHSKCTILKLNGDYKDTRIKNTPEELSNYSPALNACLDRVFDEFGLIICGWSGEWDVALCNAILRCPTRRFTTYWCTIGEPKEEAKRIIQHRHAELIHIREANTAFNELLDKVQALQDMAIPSPISGSMAVALTKRYLSEEKYRIRLHDLILNELEHAYNECSSLKFNVEHPGTTERLKSEFLNQLKRYESVTDVLLNILGTVGYFDNRLYHEQITTCVNRLLETSVQGGSEVLLNLRRYPALLIAYTVGINALVARNFQCLAAVLIEPRVVENDANIPGITHLFPGGVFSHDVGKWLPIPGADRRLTPANDYMQIQVRDKLRNTMPSDQVFVIAFDIFEYLTTITYADLLMPTNATRFWAPTGCFGWRYRNLADDKASNPINSFFTEGIALGNSWGLLASGFFGGSTARLNITRQRYSELLKTIVQMWH